MTSFDERVEFRRYKIGIIGSGPAGLSAAARAAELGISHVLLEAEEHLSNTIHKYQKGKHVMAEPRILPLRSPLAFDAGKRPELAAGEREEIAIIRSFMPAQMDEAGVAAAAATVIADLGATSIKDMGKVMAAMKERYAGQMDFAKASAVVKEILSASK